MYVGLTLVPRADGVSNSFWGTVERGGTEKRGTAGFCCTRPVSWIKSLFLFKSLKENKKKEPSSLTKICGVNLKCCK